MHQSLRGIGRTLLFFTFVVENSYQDLVRSKVSNDTNSRREARCYFFCAFACFVERHATDGTACWSAMVIDLVVQGESCRSQTLGGSV